MDPLKNLKLKWWHTILLTSSFFVFILSLTVEFIPIKNTAVMFFALGVFFISLGEVSNQSFKEGLIKDNFGNIHGKTVQDVRVSTTVGKVLWTVGLMSIFYEIFTIFSTSTKI